MFGRLESSPRQIGVVRGGGSFFYFFIFLYYRTKPPAIHIAFNSGPFLNGFMRPNDVGGGSSSGHQWTMP